jgi:hypothetical protein
MKPLEVLDFCVTYAAGTGEESVVLSGVSLATANDPEDLPSLAFRTKNAHLRSYGVDPKEVGRLRADCLGLDGCLQCFMRQARW